MPAGTALLKIARRAACVTAIAFGGSVGAAAQSATGSPADGPGALPLPPGHVVVGPVYRRDGTFVPSLTTGADANAYIFGSPPTLSFVGTAPAAAVLTTVPTQYIRFYTEGVTRAVGGFIAGSNVVRGLTAAEVKDVLALPFLPDSYTIVTVPAGTCIMVGQGAAILGNFPANPPAIPAPGPWGHGGVPQELLIGTSANPNCVDPQFLPASDYRNQQRMGPFALSYAPLAGGGNAGAVARALDHAAFPAPFTAMDSVYNALDLINIGEPYALRTALHQLGGESHADIGTLPIIASRMSMDAVAERLRHGDASGAAAGEASVGNRGDGFWITGFGGTGRLPGSADAYGFDFDIGGVVVGVDRRILPTLRLGGAFGFARGKVNLRGQADSGKDDFYSVALYGRYVPGPIYVDGTIGYGRDNSRLNRRIEFSGVDREATGDTDSNLFNAALEIGYPLVANAHSTLTPFAGGQWIRANAANFTESGAGAVNLNGRIDTATALVGRLGATVNQRWQPAASQAFELNGSIAWLHEFADTNRTATAGFVDLPGAIFTVQGASVPRDSALVSVGVAARMNGVNFHLGYAGNFASGYAVQRVVAGISAQF